jgi:hypothetical protein
MSATFYLGTQVTASADETFSFDGLEKYPGERDNRNFQSRRLTGGGSIVSYQLGLEKHFLDLNIRALSDTDRVSLELFVKTFANWAANTFEFLDSDGVLWLNCFFWFDNLRFSQSSELKYDTGITIISDGPQGPIYDGTYDYDGTIRYNGIA